MSENSKNLYVILGGSGGIGSELSRRLAEQGSRLVLAARNAERLKSLAGELDAHAHPLDATHFADVEACLSETVERWGRVDGVVNCVGSLFLKPAHLTNDEEWQHAIATNLTSAFAVVRAAGRVMKEGGSVVLLSSAAARVGLSNHEAIAAAKAGIIGLAQSAAATYAQRGLRINCVAPGLIRTPLTKRITEREASLQASIAMHPLGRIGEPGDIASTIAWFLAPEQSWVTGQVLEVDGGLASVRYRTANGG